MGQNQKLALIQPLVTHWLQQQDYGNWRRDLADAGIMDLEEAMALSQEALTVAWRTMKTLELLNADADHIMRSIDEHKLCWEVDLDYDYRHGVICY